jgi:hypothetical protein
LLHLLSVNHPQNEQLSMFKRDGSSNPPEHVPHGRQYWAGVLQRHRCLHLPRSSATIAATYHSQRQ